MTRWQSELDSLWREIDSYLAFYAVAGPRKRNPAPVSVADRIAPYSMLPTDEAVRICVEWDVEYGSYRSIIDLPEDVYLDGFTDGDAVPEWLSEQYGYTVRDWWCL